MANETEPDQPGASEQQSSIAPASEKAGADARTQIAQLRDEMANLKHKVSSNTDPSLAASLSAIGCATFAMGMVLGGLVAASRHAPESRIFETLAALRDEVNHLRSRYIG